MMDLFSSLDYCWSSLKFLKYVSFSWFFVFILVLFLFCGLYLGSFFFCGSSLYLSSVWMSKLSTKSMLVLVVIYIFQFILVGKIFGLFPYYFSVTSQILFNLCISFFMWYGVVSYFVSFSLIGFFSHLTPSGSPLILVPLLKVVEMVSILIRFLTLALRLGVKMTTGHIFLTLMGFGSSVIVSWFTYFLVLFILVGYCLFEFGVGLMQSFVFSLLVVQYADEVF